MHTYTYIYMHTAYIYIYIQLTYSIEPKEKRYTKRTWFHYHLEKIYVPIIKKYK